MKTMTLAAVLLAAAASTAGAQTAVPADSSAAPAAGTDGMTAVETDTVELTFVTPTDADFIATDLIGADIHNMDNESIGEIEDFVIRDGTELTGVVVSVGGFLGLGERHVVVDPGTITLRQAEDATGWTAMANTTREALEAAPAFEYKGAAVDN
jgi:hypothetical protein